MGEKVQLKIFTVAQNKFKYFSKKLPVVPTLFVEKVVFFPPSSDTVFLVFLLICLSIGQYHTVKTV